jgi:hypothetical protein
MVHKAARLCIDSSSPAFCYNSNIPQDPREIKCKDCLATFGLDVLSGDCRSVGSAGDNCNVRMLYAQKPFCMQCAAGWYADVGTGVCVAACATGYIPVTFGGGDVCFPAPPGCLAAQIDGSNELFCTTCDTANNYIKNQPTDKQCINLVCNNGALTMNKQCTPVVNPGLCDSNLCLWTNNIAECPTPSTCSRKMFQLDYSNLGFVIQVTQAYSYYLSYDMADFAIYDSSVSGQKRVFCRLVSDDLNDDLSRCTYINGALYIDVIDTKYRQMVAQGSITLKPSAFKVYRKLLSIQSNNLMDSSFGYGFAINSNCPLNNQLTRGASNWILLYQPSMPWTSGINAQIFQRTNKYSLQSYSWSCLSVGSDATLAAQLNSLIGGFNNQPLSVMLSNPAFQNQLITIQATVLDEYGQSYTLSMSFTLVISNPLFTQPKAEPVYFTYRDTGVYVPLVSSATIVNLNNVAVTGTNLASGGSISSSITQLVGYYLLKVVVTNNQDFQVTVSYPGKSDLVLQFVYLPANYPSSIIYEANADNISSWVFQLMNRQTTLKVYCIDESISTSCLPTSSNSRSYTPGEAVTLLDNFVFPVERPVRIFFRISAYVDETITSISINARRTTQLKTPLMNFKAMTMYPESPYHQTTLGYYLDTRVSVISSFGSIAHQYVDSQTLAVTSTAIFSLDSSQLQLSQTGPAINAHLYKSSLQFALNGGAAHSIIEARFISPPQAHPVTGRITTATADFNYLEIFSGLQPSGVVCNDSPFQFTHVYSLDQKMYFAETTRYLRRSVMPGTFTSTPISVQVTTYTYCGPQESSSINIIDTTGVAFSNTLPYYMGKLMLSLGNTVRDQMNNLNMVLYHLSRALDDCVSSASTCRTSADFVRTQASSLLTNIPATFENNKFGMLVRYSFLNGFILGNMLVGNSSLVTVLQALEATSTYISALLAVPMAANHRLSHTLHVDVSNLDLLLPEKLDFPISLGSNLLNAFLFGYNVDTNRDAMVNRTIAQIVRHKEFKMLRASSHKRLEIYQDNSIKVQAMTVLEPLDPTYQFLLSDSSLLVFKGLKFAAAATFYEIVIISWESDLLTRMKPVYNETTSDYVKRNFYVDFMNYFKQNTPIAGEVQIYGQTCTPTPAVPLCTIVTLPPPYNTYTFCDCISAPTVTGVPPLATPLPPSAGKGGSGSGGKSGGSIPPSSPKDPLMTLIPSTFDSNGSKLSPERWKNYQLWGVTTLIIEGIFAALLIIHLVLKKHLYAKSAAYCDYLGTRMLIHKMYARIDERKLTSTGETGVLKVIASEQQLGGAVRSFQSGFTMSSMPDQEKVKQQYLELKKIQGINLAELKDEDFKPLNFGAHYLKYLFLAHNFCTLIYLKSNRHTKTMQILFIFMRFFVHLALSMFFTLGAVEKQDGLSSDHWLIKAVYVPFPLWLFNFIARFLLANTDSSLGSSYVQSNIAQTKSSNLGEVEDMPNLEPAQENKNSQEDSQLKRMESNPRRIGFKKLPTNSTGDQSPLEYEKEPHNPLISKKSQHIAKTSFGSSVQNTPNRKSTNLKETGINTISPAHSRIFKRTSSTEELKQPSRVRIPSDSAIPITTTLGDLGGMNLQGPAKVESILVQQTTLVVKEPPKIDATKAVQPPSACHVLPMQILGWSLISFVLAASSYVIFSISVGDSRDNANWPWGLWYVVSLGMDVLLFQPVLSLAYFIIVWRVFNSKNVGCCGQRLTKLLISNDVIDAFSTHLQLLDRLD